MCGDSTSQKDVAKLMDGKKANMVFTDPPYNVNYKWSGENTSEGIMNDHMDSDSFDTFLDDIFARYQESTEEKSGVYVFHSTSTQTAFQNAMERNKFHIKNQLIWNKPMASLGWWDYRWKHEPFYYASSSEGGANFYGDRTHATVIDSFDGKTDQDILTMIKNAREAEKSGKATIWTMSRDNVNEYVHPTQKPVELITYALQNSSLEDQLVIDFFGGSWSTLIACEKKRRICYAMELDPKFVQVIINRYALYDGSIEHITVPQSRSEHLSTRHRIILYFFNVLLWKKSTLQNRWMRQPSSPR
jgi:DNA modification methylase